MATYLDFELELKTIEEDIISAKSKADEYAVSILEKKLNKSIKKTYENLDDFQKLKLARHIDRPYALDYVRALLTNPHEIHGDRHLRDDAAIICYFGYIGDQKVLIDRYREVL